VTASCIYEGTVRHRRAQPRRELRHRLALVYVDLDELPQLLGGRLVARAPGVVRFRRRDYLGDPAVTLDSAVRERVQAATGVRPAGPIRVLASLRSFGHCFNPVSFYYCMDRSGESVEALVAEVTNTPWGERHAYVMSAIGDSSSVIGGAFEKALHDSPFMDMDRLYAVRAGTPGETLSVHIQSASAGETAFDATLALERRPLTRASLARITARYPLASLRVLALIYANALRLWLAGARVHPHPGAPPA
jgi:hypothetical protein